MIEGLLYAISARLPCRFIDGDGGGPYLERYYLLGVLGWHLYLHRFVDSDPDRGLHDHPWDRALSLVLVTGYDEIRSDPRGGAATRRSLGPWRLNWLRGDDFHRVVLRPGQTAWTLFLHGPRTKGWGFLQNGDYRPMARNGAEFRHRDWWRQAPRGAAMRASRRAGPEGGHPLVSPPPRG
ncbi:MAG: hypothetical protein ACM3ST_11875 [Bdellovibrio bacteriovorus]